MKRLTDDLEVTLPEEALEHGFVDGLLYEDQMEDVFDELGAERDADDEFAFVSLGDYAGQATDNRSFGADRVTVVYADGGSSTARVRARMSTAIRWPRRCATCATTSG